MRASGAGAETEFLQPVPALHQTSEWVSAGLPTLRRVAGVPNVIEMPPVLAYDDVSVFVNRYGGLYVMLGVQDVQLVSGRPQPEEGGRGLVANHNSGFYADDATLITGVRLHAHMALDHLNGNLRVTH